MIVCYANQSVIAIHLREADDRGEQIKIAGKLRQISTNNLVATNHFPMVWTTGGKWSSQIYPIVSIVNVDNIVNLSHKTMLSRWVCERKAIPMVSILRYNSNSTPSLIGMADMENFTFFTRKRTMSTNTPNKTNYEIIHHRRGLLLRIGGKYVPNRRGRPKHFPLPKHIQQYLQKVGAA